MFQMSKVLCIGMEGHFSVPFSFFILSRQYLITWPGFVQYWRTSLGCSVFCGLPFGGTAVNVGIECFPSFSRPLRSSSPSRCATY